MMGDGPFSALKNGFRSISFEKISVFHIFVCRYMIIKYRSSLIWGKICQLLWELWPFYQLRKTISV